MKDRTESQALAQQDRAQAFRVAIIAIRMVVTIWPCESCCATPNRPTARIAEGAFADIVGFRAESINSPATYESPEVRPVGIEFVYRNGERMDFVA